MSLIRNSLIALSCLFIVSCSMLSSPMDGVNDQKVESATIAETIKTKDLYGAWAISDEDPVDFLYLAVFLPNHSGLNYLTIDEKDGKPESEYSEYYTWEFNEKDKIFTMNSFKRTSVINGKAPKIEELNEKTHYNTQLYMLGNEILAIRLTRPGEKYTFLKMDNATYQNLVRDNPDIPRLK